MSTDEQRRSSSALLSRDARLQAFNMEFEQFLSELDDSGKTVVWQQVNRAIWCRIFGRVAAILVCISLVGMLTYVPYLNWSASAVGRIGLIKLLPFWSWPKYHRDQCIWEKYVPPKLSKTHIFKEPTCDFCESIETIPMVIRPTISEFERFVRFHQPFVVQQSHPIRTKHEIGSFLLETPNLANSIPCDIQSNIKTSRKTRLNRLLEHTIQNMTESSKWFFAFRNCEFLATKSSRPIWPRPSFIPLHLRPFHTSWLIVASNEYPNVDTKPLELRGLVVVAQLTGRRVFQLHGTGCTEVCPKLAIELWAGETLVFLADMWRIRYEVSKGIKGDLDISVTFVAEFDWDESRW